MLTWVCKVDGHVAATLDVYVKRFRKSTLGPQPTT